MIEFIVEFFGKWIPKYYGICSSSLPAAIFMGMGKSGLGNLQRILTQP